jgi:hypothetical protein
MFAPGGYAIVSKLVALGYAESEFSNELPAHIARGPVFWKEVGITSQR